MPLATHDDYLPVLDLFLAHWAEADGAAAGLPGGIALTVLDGVDQAGVLALRGELAVRREAVRAEELSQRLGAAQLRLERGVLHVRLGQFHEAVRAWWGREPERRAVRGKPLLTAALDKFLRPVRDALRLWARLDAGPPPAGVVLPLTVGGEEAFGQPEMLARHAAALAARDVMEAAEFLLPMLRARRDAVEARVRAVLSAYLKAVPARLGSRHAVARSVPRLWPLPGHTPAAVKAAGTWDAALSAARLTWAASGDGKLSHYQVRWCPGALYDKKEERVAGRVARDAERVFLAREGLESPGDVVSIKVYVILETDNERGGAPVVVERGA